nr:uncharacterized protein LOC120964665 [Aegilops tauschii subsp. strangulata]
MMLEFNAHGLVPNWAEPAEDQVQEFFDTLEEKYVSAEPRLVQDTTQAELDYIAARAVEAELAREAGSAGGVEDKAAAEAEEKELAQWAESAGEASSAGTGAPLVEDVVDESLEEEAEAVDPPITGRGRVLRQPISGEPVRPGRAVQLRQAQETSARQTRAAAVKKVVKAAVAKKKASASSSSKRAQTPPPSPRSADVDAEVVFDFGSLSPRRKRKAAEEEVEEEEDVETMTQRVKRARTSTGGQPPADASGTLLVVLSSSDNSPRPNPQRGGQQQEEPQRATPNTPLRGTFPLEVERDGLRDQAQKLAKEKDTLNDALIEAQGAVLSRAGELSEANNSIKDLKLKLEGLEGMLLERKAREETLSKDVENEKQLRKNETTDHKDFVEGENRWIGRLKDVAGRMTM